MTSLHLVQEPEADALLASDPLALLIGMLLDQQVAMEVAFAGPKKIADRMGGGLDAAAIAGTDPEEFAGLCSRQPAVHRFPGSMASRIQALCAYLVDNYGDAAAVWTAGEPDGREVLKRLKKLPGFGDQKARIFLALLGKQFGLRAEGWREAAGDYGDEGARRSIADVVDEQSLAEVRAFKKSAKAAKKAEKGR